MDYLYKKVIPKNDKFASAYLLLGHVYRRLNNYNYSITNYEIALSYQPDLLKAKIELANLYQKMNNHHKAIKFYNAILGTNPEMSYLYKNLGDSYKNLNLNEYAEECYRYMNVRLPKGQKMTTFDKKFGTHLGGHNCGEHVLADAGQNVDFNHFKA